MSLATSVLYGQLNSHRPDPGTCFPPEDRVMRYASVRFNELYSIGAKGEEKTDHRIQDEAPLGSLIREAFRTFWNLTEGQRLALRPQSKTNSQEHSQQDRLTGVRKDKQKANS